MYERREAELALDRWRDSVVPPLRRPTPSWVLVKVKAANPVRKLPDYPEGSILQVMCKQQKYFAGFGRHTVHDFLHKLGIWPNTPPAVICASDTLYEAFKALLHTYPAMFSSPTYRTRCLSTPNSHSSLSFNYKSDGNYLRQYVWVFRKSIVRMERDDYNRFLKAGLFDPAHTIGMLIAFF